MRLDGEYIDHVAKFDFQTRRRPEFLSDMVGAEAVQLNFETLSVYIQRISLNLF